MIPCQPHVQQFIVNPIHTVCPICGKIHSVNPVRHSLAYGRPITCSSMCEIQRRKKWKWHGNKVRIRA